MFLDYYKGNKGEVCDNENEVIRSQNECIAALKFHGYQTSNLWTGTDALHHPGMPVGCSIRNSGDMKPHFIPSSTGFGKGRNDLIPICKRAKN